MAFSVLSRIFSPKYEVFNLEPKFFPESSRELIPLRQILAYGILPLGMKRARGWLGSEKLVLNLGCLDPAAFKSVEMQQLHSAMQAAHASSARKFQILPDQFFAVLRERYQLPEERLREFPESELHPRIRQWLRAPEVK